MYRWKKNLNKGTDKNVKNEICLSHLSNPGNIIKLFLYRYFQQFCEIDENKTITKSPTLRAYSIFVYYLIVNIRQLFDLYVPEIDRLSLTL
jgi:hypothetical protein